MMQCNKNYCVAQKKIAIRAQVAKIEILSNQNLGLAAFMAALLTVWPISFACSLSAWICA